MVDEYTEIERFTKNLDRIVLKAVYKNMKVNIAISPTSAVGGTNRLSALLVNAL